MLTRYSQKHLDDPLLPERDAAELLNLSIAWLQKARYLGNGPRYVKASGQGGRAVRYRRSDVMAYIEENLVETSDTLRSATVKDSNDE